MGNSFTAPPNPYNIFDLIIQINDENVLDGIRRQLKLFPDCLNLVQHYSVIGSYTPLLRIVDTYAYSKDMETKQLYIIVFLVDSGANVNYQNDTGKTPLMAAVQHNKIETAMFLFQQDINVNLQNKDGNNALMVLFLEYDWKSGDYQIFTLIDLFMNKGIDLNTINADNKTAYDILQNNPTTTLKLAVMKRIISEMKKKL